MSRYLAAGTIDIGTDHPRLTIGGMIFNLDTIWATVVAGTILVLFGLFIARRATSGVPKGPQLVWETVISTIEDQVEDSIGRRVAPFVVPLATALFFFILFANWLEIIPTEHHLPSPTADVNLTFALAILVIVWVHITGVRKRGAGRYFGHFFKPLLLSPINVIEELVKPVTLALRLFGNIFAGGVMISVIGLMPAFILWAPNALWKLFDMVIGVIQAFIFALLTILYFSFAVGGHGEDETRPASDQPADESTLAHS
ncbi:MAG: F0F1 ATP synthase subunit A [Actinobacteria bacterium]|nr:F0F1 ATP synthase subunit A [Actinomycetota bacterium]